MSWSKGAGPARGEATPSSRVRRRSRVTQSGDHRELDRARLSRRHPVLESSSPAWPLSRGARPGRLDADPGRRVDAPSEPELPSTLTHLKPIPVRILEPRDGTPWELEDL